MSANMTIQFFYLDPDDLEHGYAAEYLKGATGLKRRFPQITLVNLAAQPTVDGQLDVLIVEDSLEDMLEVIGAAEKSPEDIHSLGLCYGTPVLMQLLDRLADPPKVVTLDFELKGSDQIVVLEASFAATERTYEAIATKEAWGRTVVIGLTYHFKLPQADQLRKRMRRRGDSVFFKKTALWDILPEILSDSLRRYEVRCEVAAYEQLAADLVEVKAQSLPVSRQRTPMEESVPVGAADSFVNAKQRAALLARSSVILLIGESGVGKELFARYIHQCSPGANGPFLVVECTSLSESLLESEFFGHAKGAFTGAVAEKMGVFEMANGGTVFLDEIGDVSKAQQAKLLRVLQEKQIKRVGEAQFRHLTNIRFIAATNRNLWQMKEKGEFREDLYYRLTVTGIRVPPLRERRSDIPLLVQYLVPKLCRELGLSIPEIPSDVMDLIRDYDPYPGNIRQLVNRLTQTLLLADSRVLTASDVNLHFPAAAELDEAGQDCGQRQQRVAPSIQTRSHSSSGRRNTIGPSAPHGFWTALRDNEWKLWTICDPEAVRVQIRACLTGSRLEQVLSMCDVDRPGAAERTVSLLADAGTPPGTVEGEGVLSEAPQERTRRKPQLLGARPVTYEVDVIDPQSGEGTRRKVQFGPNYYPECNYFRMLYDTHSKGSPESSNLQRVVAAVLRRAREEGIGLREAFSGMVTTVVDDDIVSCITTGDIVMPTGIDHLFDTNSKSKKSAFKGYSELLRYNKARIDAQIRQVFGDYMPAD